MVKNYTLEELNENIGSLDAINALDFVIGAMDRDKTIGVTDSVFHDCTYEELSGALLAAKADLDMYKRDSDAREFQIDLHSMVESSKLMFKNMDDTFVVEHASKSLNHIWAHKPELVDLLDIRSVAYSIFVNLADALAASEELESRSMH